MSCVGSGGRSGRRGWGSRRRMIRKDAQKGPVDETNEEESKVTIESLFVFRC
jgi:hypothetical protein